MKRALLAASRSPRARRIVERSALTRPVVQRFVPGTGAVDAVRATEDLLATGRVVTLDFLGEDTLERAQAEVTVTAYLRLLEHLGDLEVGDRAEVSVKLSAVGQAFDNDLAIDSARTICEAADQIGTTVTLDMEDHTTTDSTLEALQALRAEFPRTGAVVQAYLHRTEDDCRALATTGSRVRLCKGAYKEPSSVAFQNKSDVDDSYLRCLEILMAGPGYPMIASHDPRIVAATRERTAGRAKGTYEYQMLYGIRSAEQQRLADEGETMRVYVPYGDEYFGYFMRRLAERPANLIFFLRAMLGKG